MRKRIETAVEQIEEYANTPVEREKPIDMSMVVSTGSTLLDLAISGNRIYGGGIPGGILVEVSGPPSAGKTALLVEICTSAQLRGGKVRLWDPEGRLDKEYAEIYGLSIKDLAEYGRPDTVDQLIDKIRSWEGDDSVINVDGADSVAALSTDEELKDSDKYGAKRAKDFSEGLRKVCREIAHNHRLVIFTNQLRETFNEGGFGPKDKPTGGNAIPYYCSLRISIRPAFPQSKIKRKRKVGNTADVERTIGVISNAVVFKNSVDDPYREAKIPIVFGYGIDDVRANLEFVKFASGTKGYNVYGGQHDREIVGIDAAITVVEEKELQEDLKKRAIELWYGVEKVFAVSRKPKVRV